MYFEREIRECPRWRYVKGTLILIAALTLLGVSLHHYAAGPATASAALAKQNPLVKHTSYQVDTVDRHHGEHFNDSALLPPDPYRDPDVHSLPHAHIRLHKNKTDSRRHRGRHGGHHGHHEHGHHGHHGKNHSHHHRHSKDDLNQTEQLQQVQVQQAEVQMDESSQFTTTGSDTPADASSTPIPSTPSVTSTPPPQPNIPANMLYSRPRSEEPRDRESRDPRDEPFAASIASISTTISRSTAPASSDYVYDGVDTHDVLGGAAAVNHAVALRRESEEMGMEERRRREREEKKLPAIVNFNNENLPLSPVDLSSSLSSSYSPRDLRSQRLEPLANVVEPFSLVKAPSFCDGPPTCPAGYEAAAVRTGANGCAVYKCIKLPSPAEGCIWDQKDYDYPGNDVGVHPYIPSADECCLMCWRREDCHAWTYVPAWDPRSSVPMCYLKANAESRRYVYRSHFMSGYKNKWAEVQEVAESAASTRYGHYFLPLLVAFFYFFF